MRFHMDIRHDRKYNCRTPYVRKVTTRIKIERQEHGIITIKFTALIYSEMASLIEREREKAVSIEFGSWEEMQVLNGRWK